MISRRSLFRRAALIPAAILARPVLGRAREPSPPTNFLQAPGMNGYITTPFDLVSSELDSLKNGAGATSSIGGRNGIFTREQTGNAIFAAIYFVSGGSFTPSVAAADFAGWFLASPDGGSTFETVVQTPNNTNLALTRPPDFIIPLGVGTYAAGNQAWCSGGIVQLPWGAFKLEVQQFSGVSLPPSGNLIKCAPVAVQH
jgi:hypothetical protein